MALSLFIYLKFCIGSLTLQNLQSFNATFNDIKSLTIRLHSMTDITVPGFYTSCMLLTNDMMQMHLTVNEL